MQNEGQTPASNDKLLRMIRQNLKRGDQADVAEDLDVSRSAVSQVLSGDSDSKEIFEALFDRAVANKKARDERISMLNPAENE